MNGPTAPSRRPGKSHFLLSSRARTNPRSLADQGLDRAPEPRLAPYHSTQAKYYGRLTPAWEHTLETREARTPQHAQEQARARAYWETRKQALGLTPDMPREAML